MLSVFAKLNFKPILEVSFYRMHFHFPLGSTRAKGIQGFDCKYHFIADQLGMLVIIISENVLMLFKSSSCRVPLVKRETLARPDLLVLL